MKIFVILFLHFVFLGFNSQAQVRVQIVINAERAFAKMAITQDTRAAFLANMSENSLLEQKGKLVKGRPIYLNLPPDTTGKLIWDPVIATISASEDLGYTSGPYKYQVKGKDVAFGDFATVWEKQPSGQWKFEIDLGNSHAPTLTTWKINEVKTIVPAPVKSRNKDEVDLIEVDQTLASKIQPGSAAGYLEVLHPDARILRTGKAPYLTEAEKKALFVEKTSIQFTPEGYKLSSSHDLGVVYGSCKVTTSGSDQNSSQKGVYMHVWRKDPEKGWQLLHESINVHPPAPPAEKKQIN
ncbi:MAG: nuclear transport factor 2 family protein [Bacteroidota bacterium]|nr:nuclear transport factor 2 family protein [Bacteroidota bacterium]